MYSHQWKPTEGPFSMGISFLWRSLSVKYLLHLVCLLCMQAGSVDTISLTTLNLPVALTQINCVYRLINGDSFEPLMQPYELFLTANSSRTGDNKVDCLLSNDKRDTFLDISKFLTIVSYHCNNHTLSAYSLNLRIVDITTTITTMLILLVCSLYTVEPPNNEHFWHQAFNREVVLSSEVKMY